MNIFKYLLRSKFHKSHLNPRCIPFVSTLDASCVDFVQRRFCKSTSLLLAQIQFETSH